MKEKEFLDVFPQLKVEHELEQLLKTVKVMKVAVTPRKDMLRIYIMSSQWIHKKNIYQLEESIREQFFSGTPLQVKIIEKFVLSRQYTPENFLDVYKPSILLELKHYSMLEFNMFATAEISFPEPETMDLVMTDSAIAREREAELVRILEKIFCERCGFNLKVHTDYKKPVESKVRRNSELRIMEEAKQIFLHSRVGQAAGGEPVLTVAEPEVKQEEQENTEEDAGETFSGMNEPTAAVDEEEEETENLPGQRDMSDYPEYVPDPQEKGLSFTEWIGKKYGTGQYNMIGKVVRDTILTQAQEDKEICPKEWEGRLTNALSVWVMEKTREYQTYLQG